MNRFLAFTYFLMWHTYLSLLTVGPLFYFDVFSGPFLVEGFVFVSIIISAVAIYSYREACKFYEGRCIL